MRARFGIVVASCLFVGAFVAEAQAALVVHDLNTAGDSLVTLDTRTGLDWLDFSASLGISPLSALAANPGFRLANRSEVESLFISAGIPAGHIGDGTVYAADLAAGHLLADTLGVTLSAFNGAVEQIHGRVLRDAGDRYDLYFAEIRTPPAGSPGLSTDFIELGNVLGAWQSNHANFMVRDAAVDVPEPMALALFAVGLVAIGATRRSARR